MKKNYIAPTLKVRELRIKHHLLTDSSLDVGTEDASKDWKDAEESNAGAKSDVGFVGFGE